MTKKEFKLLGNYLKKKRALSGLSQGKVAKILGYKNAQFISNIERGLCAVPMNKLRILIDVYDLNPLELTKFLLELQKQYMRRELAITRVYPKKKYAV